MTTMKIVIVLFAILAVSYGRQGFGPGEQDWDYVTVRPKAHMFWWLYFTTADVKNVTERPLVIWLQGGPGASSTGFGNFAEIGPLDVDLNPREKTWVKEVNVLFIDNPVGTGYSYVEHNSALTTTNQQIAEDLAECLEGFYRTHPEFRNVPLYIASESYGGKMAVDIALELYKRDQLGQMRVNLKGVSLIDSWLCPILSVLNWAPFLYNVGAVDQEGYDAIDKGAQRTKAALDAGQFEEATNQWLLTEYIIMDVAKNVDFYNILTKIKSRSGKGRHMIKPGVDTDLTDDEKLEELMNGPVKKALNLNVTWGAQSGDVFDTLSEDFMKSVTERMDKLLDETTVKVQVVTGQLDLIVDTPGTLQCVELLKWSRSHEWKDVPRDALSVNGINEGYQKLLGKFSMYWVNRAGHMVPADNPDAMLKILHNLLGS
ncbi:hypothetical protein ILUMI_07278 [Ignelater luminosus]|uniref:Carboxypeptidase n=1 Tax=Ignelater luminosus TaxID=2038154 RepID=A0A8K0D3R7_IGNLU|nr:hypothetical protein ILUMI_07278 [Ignelater luminosus]